MPYEFPPDVDQRVITLLGRGYENVDEVLRCALNALEREQEEFAAIEAGIDDMEAGRYRTVDEADAELRQLHNFPPDT